MPPLAFALVAIAAVLHVAWNVLLKTAGDPLRTAATGIIAAAALVVPAAAIGWWLSGRPPIGTDVLLLAAVSGALEVAYFVLLSAAYRRGDLSVTYPIARGTAPLLAVGAGVLLLGEQLPQLAWLGVALLLAGLLVLQRPWRLLSRGVLANAGESAVPFALATGVAIAAYSAVDRVAVRLVPPWLYAGLLWLFMAAGLALVVVFLDRRRRGSHSAPPPLDRGRAVLGGLLTLTAYVMVLGAFAIAPLATVAPLRESAIVLASGWGVVRLGEGGDARQIAFRLGAAGLVLAGAVLLAIAR